MSCYKDTKKSEPYSSSDDLSMVKHSLLYSNRGESQSLLLFFKITSVFKCTQFLDFVFFDHFG